MTSGFWIYQLDYRHIQLFRHDCLSSICGEVASHAYEGLILIARHAGPWWAFAHGVVLCDRPKSIERDADGNLHCANAPAATYRTGLELFAWHGVPVPSEAILQPESLKHSYISAQVGTKMKEALIEIYGKERYERERRPAPKRPLRNPLDGGVPFDFDLRIKRLREYGPLPRYERYLQGGEREVWSELIALGPSVRDDAHAPDAYAVASETMRRVRDNLISIIDRLIATGYEFTADEADVVVPFGIARKVLAAGKSEPDDDYPLQGPNLHALQELRRLEKDAGLLPLSVRIWYEIVGSVSLRGAFRSGASNAIPQFAIVPFSKILYDWDNSPPEVGPEDRPFVASITSHEPPYQITLPAPAMDALLENHPEGLNFFDFLRRELDRCAAALELELLPF